MDSRLKIVLILLVGAAVGGIVSNAAISYVNRPSGPQVVEPVAASSTSIPVSGADESSPDRGDTPVDEPLAAPVPRITRQRGEPRLYGSDGPDVSVSSEEGSAPPPSPKPAPKEKTAAPVVEEEPDSSKEGDGGGLRDEGAKDGDGGSIR